jgi:hypothetical protein
MIHPVVWYVEQLRLLGNIMYSPASFEVSAFTLAGLFWGVTLSGKGLTEREELETVYKSDER